MRNSAGMNTSPVFGFTKFLCDIITRERPHHLGVAFDPAGGTFRNRLYPLYKANRSQTPEDIVASVPYIKRILAAMHIPVLEVPDFEADDVIGTLSTKAAAEGYDVYMVTPDKDFGQLVSQHARIYKQRSGGEGVEIIGPDQIRAHYGFDDPRLVADVLALWGDAADNIPGVQGIGEKGAIKLVSAYGSIESIMQNVDSLKGRQRENIIAGSEQLRLAKELATIRLDVPIELRPKELVMERPDCTTLKEIFEELNFNMFIRQMQSVCSSPLNDLMPSRESGNSQSTAPIHQPIAMESAQEPMQTDLFGNAVPQKSAAPQNRPKSDTRSMATTDDLFAAAAAGVQTIVDTPHYYRTVTTDAELDSLVEELSRAEEFAFDVETTGLDFFSDRIVGISFCMRQGEATYVPLSPQTIEARIERLRQPLEDEHIAKVGQNIKFDIMMLRMAGVKVGGFKFDTMILHYLLDSESRHGMDFLSRTLLNYQPIEIEELIGRASKQITMDQVAIETVAEYCSEDSDVTMRLKNLLWPRVVQEGFENLYRNIEEPLIDTLADIELTGVKIDVEQLNLYAKQLNIDMANLEEQIRTLADMPTLNINSSRQLGVVLFEKMKIDPKPRLTKTKQYSTDEEYLQFLSDRHPIIGLILDYRGVKKLLSTYVEALPALVNRVSGRVHTSFNQAVTATGRLSSTNPNLQNIPIRDERGREIRRAFVPAAPDRKILSADYSQVELRLMAHLSGDEHLIEAFAHGEDIHRATAARLFNLPPEQVSADLRRKAKTANFGIIYGISAFGLKQRIADISLAEAKEIIDGYFASYPRVKQYMERVVDEARCNGYVETLFGRRRYLPDIRSGNSVVRSLAERNAINAPIQGSAADIIKIAMNSVHHRFEQEGLQSKIILQVHDELVIDMLIDEQAAVEQIVKESMEGAAHLSVNLTAECGVGDNWLEAH